MSYTILSLPTDGTLLGPDGQPVTVGQVFNVVSPALQFVPNVGVSGTTQFGYAVNNGTIVDEGLVVVDILAFDTCTPVGRLPGCAPTG